MFKKDISWPLRISRPKVLNQNRFRFLRLDRNEWIGDLNKKISKRILKNIDLNKISTYPEPFKLYRLLAQNHKVNLNQIVLTPGSDAGIKNCIELCFRGNNSNNELISLNPSYEMVKVYAKLYKIKHKTINYDQNLTIKIEKILKAINKKTSLIVLANPNSPTGTIIKNNDLKKIIIKAKKFKALVLIDEAYHGFYKGTVIGMIKKYNNLIISRSLSKFAGLAGVRIGYLVSNEKVSKLLYNLKPTHEINSIGIELAFNILKNQKLISNYFNEVQRSKSKLIEYLKLNNYEFIKTQTNFMYLYCKNKNLTLLKKLKQKKILVGKNMPIKKFRKYIRVTIGPQKEMQTLFKLLKTI